MAQDPLVLNLFAKWSKNCEAITRMLELKLQENKGVKMINIDIDKFPELAKVMKIKHVPTCYLVYNTQGLDRM